MTKGKLPIGIQTFQKVREEGCYYVDKNVYLFEFKVVELAAKGGAMAQLQAKGYADKYRRLEQPIHLVAVEFSKESRNIVAFEVRPA